MSSLSSFPTQNKKRLPSFLSARLKRTRGGRFKALFRPFKNNKDCRAFVVSRSLLVLKRRDADRFFTFSGRYHYLWKVLLGRNDRAVLSSIVLYFFGLERHNCTKKHPPGVSFSAVFSNSLNMKKRRALPLSGSLKLNDIGLRQKDALQEHAIPVKLVIQK